MSKPDVCPRCGSEVAAIIGRTQHFQCDATILDNGEFFPSTMCRNIQIANLQSALSAKEREIQHGDACLDHLRDQLSTERAAREEAERRLAEANERIHELTCDLERMT